MMLNLFAFALVLLYTANVHALPMAENDGLQNLREIDDDVHGGVDPNEFAVWGLRGKSFDDALSELCKNNKDCMDVDKVVELYRKLIQILIKR